MTYRVHRIAVDENTAQECPMSLDVQAMVSTGFMTATECILCAQCSDTCPRDTISVLFLNHRAG